MSRRGQHHSRVSSLASLASASSATDRCVDSEHPPYQQPWLNRLVQLFISLHNALVIPVIFAFTSALYAAISQLFGRPKYPTPDPSNGAIVVLNSTGGIGRDIALALASRGWTVFAYGETRDQAHEVLSPTRSTEPSPRSLGLSMLLYLWHRRNERRHTGSRDFSSTFGSPLPRTTSSPGTIIPISSQSGSPSERENAVETIRAFCRSQDRQLHAIIAPPLCPGLSRVASSVASSPRSHWQPSVEEPTRAVQQGERRSWICKQVSVTGAQQADYEMNLQARLSEPLLVTKELLPLLRPNNGRVIFVEGCGDSNIFTGTSIEGVFETARRSAVATLRKELRSVVNVSVIHTGPLLSHAHSILLDNGQVHSESSIHTAKEELMQRDLQAAQNWWTRFLVQYLYCFSLRPSTICASVQQALVCAHPRPIYHVGLLALSPTAILEQFFMLSIFSTLLRHWVGLEL